MPENIKCRDCIHLFDGGLGMFCCADLPAWAAESRVKTAPMAQVYADTIRSCESFDKKEPDNVQS